MVGLALVEVPELGAVMGGRARDGPPPDKAMRLVDAGMVFVTEHWNGDVMRLCRRRYRRLTPKICDRSLLANRK
jgi:hypothetical protein